VTCAWRVAAPLRELTRAVRANPAARDLPPIDEAGPSDVRDLIAAFNAYRAAQRDAARQGLAQLRAQQRAARLGGVA